MVTSWFDYAFDAMADAWQCLGDVWNAITEAAAAVLVVISLVGLVITFGPAILLLLTGAPLWAAIAILFVV